MKGYGSWRRSAFSGQRSDVSGDTQKYAEPKSGCQVCFPHGPFWPRVGRPLMADAILDQLAAGIPNAQAGFTLLFSAQP